MSKLITYKGTDKDMKCHGRFQYELGKEYKDAGAVRCGGRGFHSCKAPLDVFRYFAPNKSRYFVCEAGGTMDEDNEDSKIASSELTLKTEIGIPGLVKAHIAYVKAHTTTEHTDPKQATAGDSGAATAGDSGAATAGYCGAATAGYCGAATAGDCGAATAGHRGAATAGDRGAATAGDYGAATAGHRGAATAGHRGAATAGDCGAATAGDCGAATAGHRAPEIRRPEDQRCELFEPGDFKTRFRKENNHDCSL